MAASNDQNSSTYQPSSSQYSQAVCRVAVAQICFNAGYRGAEAAALRVLTDIATRYIRLLASSAASAANSCGRTQSNILDLALVLEGVAAGRGYAGAANVTRSLLKSSVLLELRAFVAAIDEIPFPQPIRRQMAATDAASKPTPSFAQTGKEPPLPHVPRWLPCFPEGWSRAANRTMIVESDGQKPAISLVIEKKATRRDIMREKRTVKFRLGFAGDIGGRKRNKIEFRNRLDRSEEPNVEEIDVLKGKEILQLKFGTGDANRTMIVESDGQKPAISLVIEKKATRRDTIREKRTVKFRLGFARDIGGRKRNKIEFRNRLDRSEEPNVEEIDVLKGKEILQLKFGTAEANRTMDSCTTSKLK